MISMESKAASPLVTIEPRLRYLLPADLYAAAWVTPSSSVMMRVFEHLRTLQRILYDYVPRHVSEALPNPGEARYEWQDGALMFTDLAGFTPLLEASAEFGRAGAETLLTVLNAYFAEMLEIISKSGGNLLEFTGDAMLVQFPSDQRHTETARAVRAGLRMQRAMIRFSNIEMPQGNFSLGMRIGINTGRVLTADIGTPRRMEHVLLGSAVRATKHAEGWGMVGRVCITADTYTNVESYFRSEDWRLGHKLVMDDFDAEQLGEYDFAPASRRLANPMLFDRSGEGLLAEIEKSVKVVEPLASYLPLPILSLLVESAARREIRPTFPELTVLFVNLLGLPEAVDRARENEEAVIVNIFSRVFALINAAVEARGGVLKNVTYHLAGSDILIYFGVPNAHTDDSIRAAHVALGIREIVNELQMPTISGQEAVISFQIGMARGPVFAAEIGEPRGRREFNILGDTVNVAARLMGRAGKNQILMTEAVCHEISEPFNCEALGTISLKGKAVPLPVYALLGEAGDAL
jgi:class 3 adenylate cyclase